MKYGTNLGLATYPKQLKLNGIKSLLHRALWKQGIRVSTAKRHPFKITYGYRKFAIPNAEQGGMKSINVKMLMGHSIGVEDSYYRPQEQDISDD